MRSLVTLLGLVFAATACSALSGLDGFELNEGGGTGDGGSDPTSVGGGAVGGNASAGGNTSSGGSTNVGGTGGNGGSGGPPPEPECGNGIIEQGEQCDAGAQTTYCNEDCEVTGCRGNHDHLDPATGHCYRYSDADGAFGSWAQAQTFCANWGGQLLVLNGQAERTFIASLVGTLAYNGAEFLWVGANDSNADGDYQWVDGSPLPSSSPFWQESPPNGGCAAIMPQSAALTASANCQGDDLPTYHLHHACEREPEGQSP